MAGDRMRVSGEGCLETTMKPSDGFVARPPAAVSVLAVPSALGNGAVGVFNSLPGLGIGFLDLMVNAWNEFALPIGGCLTAIFIGRVWREGGPRARGAPGGRGVVPGAGIVDLSGLLVARPAPLFDWSSMCKP